MRATICLRKMPERWLYDNIKLESVLNKTNKT